jgi:hypothetical protein
MKAQAALLLAVVLVAFPFTGIAAEKKITDVKELAGSYQGWVTNEMGQERANMVVQPNGSYRASTVRGTTSEGQFYLQDGKLLYRSSRTTGKAQLSEDKGKTTLSVIPEDATYGRGDYARLK